VVMANVVTALGVLEAVGELQPVGVRELARATGVPKSTVQRCLDTLGQAGWVVQGPSSAWSLSLRAAVVGAHAGSSGALRDLARPAMLRLHDEYDETVRLWVPDGERIVVVESVESQRALRTVAGSTSMPLHATAAGKAVLAALPSAELDVVLSRPLVALTPQTVTDPGELREQLAASRARGWTETRHEAHPDIGAVAAALVDPSGRPVGALALTLPMHRVTPELAQRYGGRVAEEVAALSRALAGPDRPARPR
jgi:IclR family transcriptional regulator, acetate operon repressor